MTDVTTTTTVIDVLPTIVIAFVIGTCAYPLGSWLRAWVERVRPVKWCYRDVCGRQCGIRS